MNILRTSLLALALGIALVALVPDHPHVHAGH